MRDEAEIRGHRRAYIKVPGRIIRALRDAKTRNPVIVLDEIDKVGTDWRATRPRRCWKCSIRSRITASPTTTWVPFDLSRVIFIATNQLSTIPGVARPHGVETMPGYIEDEKLAIASNTRCRNGKEAKRHQRIRWRLMMTLRGLIRYYAGAGVPPAGAVWAKSLLQTGRARCLRRDRGHLT